MYDIIKQSHMHDPYIPPIIDLEKNFERHKTLLYGLKKQKKQTHTLFDQET